ncbi:MAG TPA: MFS transporter [Woeseiaceae bacterium]|nr:MFS transporter [Woeseiaceae bacterium]
MASNDRAPAARVPARDLWGYATGESVNSVAINGISNFALLFYTQVMGMSPELAGLALFVATFWDAVSDPIMGSVTDHTNTRWGRRHPYMVVGGFIFSIAFVALWLIPESVQGEAALFVYLLSMNLIVKTAFTIFVVPYMALGFEMCRTYDDRARLQGIRYGFNMFVNIVTGGFGWVLFFPDQQAADGTLIDGTRIESNYQTMGVVLGITTLLLILFCVYVTYKYADRSRRQPAHASAGGGMRGAVQTFFHDVRDVYSDRLVWFVFLFFGLAQFSMLIVSQVQMFTYVEYMRFTAVEKTFVHTAGMVAFATGSLVLGRMVRRFDKKKTGVSAMLFASAGSLGLFAVFIGGLLDPQSEPSGFPLAVVAFALLQMMWWGGTGVLVPLATSMIADLAEIKRWQSGEVTEGRYAAGFSFFLKLAISFGLFVTGYILKFVGYESGAPEQAPDAVHNLAVTTFLAGPLLLVLSFAVLRRYPVTHETIRALRDRYERPA